MNKLHISKGNSKIGKTIYSFSTLPGNKKNLIKARGKVLTTTPGTCSKHCEGCFNSGCYAVRSVRLYHNSVLPAWEENTRLLRRGTLWNKIDKYLTSANAKVQKVKYFRINVSGEIRNTSDLIQWNKLATKHSKVIFSVYTKNYEALSKFIKRMGKTGVAKNFVINVSQWNGVADKFLSKYPEGTFNVFEYDGSNKQKERAQMAAANISRLSKITHCPAVTKDGHHATTKDGKPITCDMCLQCYRKTGKTVAVYAH